MENYCIHFRPNKRFSNQLIFYFEMGSWFRLLRKQKPFITRVFKPMHSTQKTNFFSVKCKCINRPFLLLQTTNEKYDSAIYFNRRVHLCCRLCCRFCFEIVINPVIAVRVHYIRFCFQQTLPVVSNQHEFMSHSPHHVWLEGGSRKYKYDLEQFRNNWLKYNIILW